MDTSVVWTDTDQLPPVGAKVRIMSSAFTYPQDMGYVSRVTKTTFVIKTVKMTMETVRVSPVDSDHRIVVDWTQFTGETRRAYRRG